MKCVQPNGSRHVFTLKLPRQDAPHGDCLECERPVERHEGPPAPRQQLYTVKEVARALIRVGEGMPYRGAGRMLRREAERLKISKFGFAYPSRDSSVVEDWVEVFAPVVFEPHAPSEWPALVMLDDLPFDIRSTMNAGGKKIVFRIFGALGYDEQLKRSIVRLEAFPNKTAASWKRYLTSIPGRPQGIVCDNESGMLSGIAQAWPHTPEESSPLIWLCHWHLKNALQKLLYRYGKLHTPLAVALNTAFQNQTQWDAFCQLARQSNFPAIEKWARQSLADLVGRERLNGTPNRLATRPYAQRPDDDERARTAPALAARGDQAAQVRLPQPGAVQPAPHAHAAPPEREGERGALRPPHPAGLREERRSPGGPPDHHRSEGSLLALGLSAPSNEEFDD